MKQVKLSIERVKQSFLSESRWRIGQGDGL